MQEIVQVKKVSPGEWPDTLQAAREFVLVATPEIRQDIVDRLFEIERPLKVKLLTSRDQIETLDTCFRQRLEQLRDINFNIEIRLDERNPPAGLALDGHTWVVPTNSREPLPEDEARSLMADLEDRWQEAEEWPIPDTVEPDLRKHPEEEGYKE